MTDPIPVLSDSGRSVVVGSNSVLLTETGPLTVINTSLTTRIWLGSSSSVSAGNGVPVEPGTSYAWTADGMLFAVRDAAATTDASVTITGSGSDWTASPIAIGAAVAAQLLAGGVPIVARTKNVFEGFGLPGASTYPVGGGWLDVTGFSSLELSFTILSGATTVQGITFRWTDDAVQQAGLPIRSDEFTTYGDGGGNDGQSISVPIRADYVQIVLTTSPVGNVLGNAALTLSTRPVDRPRTHAVQPGRYSILGLINGNIFANPLSIKRAYFTPAEGRVSWTVSYNVAVGQCDFTVFAVDAAGAEYQLFLQTINAGAGTVTFITDSPLLATIFQVRNYASTGAAATVRATATRIAV